MVAMDATVATAEIVVDADHLVLLAAAAAVIDVSEDQAEAEVSATDDASAESAEAVATAESDVSAELAEATAITDAVEEMKDVPRLAVQSPQEREETISSLLTDATKRETLAPHLRTSPSTVIITHPSANINQSFILQEMRSSCE